MLAFYDGANLDWEFMGKATSKTVSVVLATHNGASYIEEQVRSISPIKR
jgi:hypothetical protein